MGKIHDLYAAGLTGICVHMLLNDQPMTIKKATYILHNYLIKEGLIELSENLPNVNNWFYPLVFDRHFQYSILNNETQKYNKINITLRAVFCIFRYKVKKGNKDEIETKINLMSLYPIGNDKDYQCEAWKNDINLPVRSPKEKRKFDEMKEIFKPLSIQEILHKLYPYLENNNEKKAYFKKIFHMDSFNKNDFDRCMIWFAD
jgi:hypothetical protein